MRKMEKLASKYLIEKLANLAHEQWGGWMKYLFSKALLITENCQRKKKKVIEWKPKRL